ncbi:2-polyprenyl-6-methoxyphenol hydroxylase-like FAD-dependent oxidoreductase [Kitasatospora sp. MAP12-15]|uniref:FAD-dependent oxidoreductase n=1 Tax=unclassified Kitasatospora TaxID=2633591 RepID=UPI002476147C|nr:NAD-binding protein [Kitasatospora sp. MAP12-44]MDH6113952.1 2-polyprenyl-6-methoxyphenol hydroxylase-like FAD-dependent oxidoreductase [Kitasatospora sp. MAP12-44]
MVHITVLGGGIGGLSAALFLGRRGHQVTVLEREIRRARADLDRDFLDWQRPGVPQAVQPHVLNAPVRTVLLAEAPDVYDAMLRLGAREQHEFDWFDEHPPYRPGDEQLVRVKARRIVLEAALREAAEQQPEVTIHQGIAVTGLLTDGGKRVTGVRSSAGVFGAELVVDAGGRRSPVPGWIAELAGRAPLVESHRIGIGYFCRWYRLRPQAPEDPGRVPGGAAAAFATGGVFPSDNRVFAVALTLSTADPTRGALRDPAVFEAVARTFAGCAHWLALPHDPIGPVRAMAGLENRWTSLVDADGPLATGLIGIGDTMVHTNPTHGQGLPLTLWAAQWLAHHVDQPGGTDLETDYHRWAVDTLKPWFDRQVVADRSLRDQLAGREPGPRPGADPIAAALPWCALEDPLVMRARAQARHLLLTPAQAYGAPEVQERVARWIEANPGFTPPQDSPSRELWERLTTGNYRDTVLTDPADWPDFADSAQNGCPS